MSLAQSQSIDEAGFSPVPAYTSPSIGAEILIPCQNLAFGIGTAFDLFGFGNSNTVNLEIILTGRGVEGDIALPFDKVHHKAGLLEVLWDGLHDPKDKQESPEMSTLKGVKTMKEATGTKSGYPHSISSPELLPATFRHPANTPLRRPETPWTSNPRWIARIEALQVLRALNFFEWAGIPRAFFTTNNQTYKP